MYIRKIILKTIRSHLAYEALEQKDFKDRGVKMRHTLRAYKFSTKNQEKLWQKLQTGLQQKNKNFRESEEYFRDPLSTLILKFDFMLEGC